METNQTQEATGKITLLTIDAGQLVDEIVQALSERGGPPNLASNDPYLGVQEAAQYLGCKPRRIYDLKIDNRLRCVKDGSRVLTRRSWIDAYLNGAS